MKTDMKKLEKMWNKFAFTVEVGRFKDEIEVISREDFFAAIKEYAAGAAKPAGRAV